MLKPSYKLTSALFLHDVKGAHQATQHLSGGRKRGYAPQIQSEGLALSRCPVASAQAPAPPPHRCPASAIAYSPELGWSTVSPAAESVHRIASGVTATPPGRIPGAHRTRPSRPGQFARRGISTLALHIVLAPIAPIGETGPPRTLDGHDDAAPHSALQSRGGYDKVVSSARQARERRSRGIGGHSGAADSRAGVSVPVYTCVEPRGADAGKRRTDALPRPPGFWLGAARTLGRRSCSVVPPLTRLDVWTRYAD
ncbi:hypothetical protein B0H17DRAFT_1216960 [Mycena rosella]|uniref:Uncharacterized protein n=1 Tax=Mycena rosella TaxID=1033263 RepID=A0AAD7FT38_MYCRO|nr:hypothetical protein B0H17DRAFT_1216960 [Mycena rosella]